MAVFGKTVYVVYVFSPNTIANYSLGDYSYPGVSVAPVVQIVYTTNGGTSWNGPYHPSGSERELRELVHQPQHRRHLGRNGRGRLRDQPLLRR